MELLFVCLFLFWFLSHASPPTVAKCFFQENEQLRSSLMQAHTDISVLHSEVDKLKNLYLDQKELHER